MKNRRGVFEEWRGRRGGGGGNIPMRTKKMLKQAGIA